MNLSVLGSKFILIHEGRVGKYAVVSATGSYQNLDQSLLVREKGECVTLEVNQKILYNSEL
jgi:hypothetical protein